jgi:mitochondrial splicing suppressor protein 51
VYLYSLLNDDNAFWHRSARTDRLMRMETIVNQSSLSPNTLKACSACKMAFYCSDAHWEAVRQFHDGQPCEDGHDDLSQCQVNKEVRGDIFFANLMAGAKAGSFKWAPERVKPAWTSLRGINWVDEFGQELAEHFSIPVSAIGPWIRAASDGLSMPMSILWALENLNEDDAWTRKGTLTIHVNLT